MTVSTSTSRISYTGAGSAGPFAVPFKFLTDADLLVIRRTVADGTEVTMVLTTDYTVSGAGADAGGSITLTLALSSAYQLVIIRDPDLLQETDFVSNDDLASDTIERGLDKLTMIAQRSADVASRSLRLSDGETASIDIELPAAVGEKFWRWNAAGTAVEFVDGFSPGTLIVSAFVEILLDDATPQVALNTLNAGLVTETAASQSFAAADCGEKYVFTSTATHTFAAAATLGNGWHIYVRNTGIGVNTFNPDGSELIDGAATIQLYPGESCIIVCTGTAFVTYGLQDSPRIIESQTLSAEPTADFDVGFDTDHNQYELEYDLVPATDDVYLFLRVGTGAGPTWQSGAGAYSWGGRMQGPNGGNDLGSTADSFDTAIALSRIGVGQGVGNAAGEHIAGRVRIHSPADTTNQVLIDSITTYKRSDAAGCSAVVGGLYGGPSVTGIRLGFSSGNIASGWATLKGLRKAR